MRTFSELWQKFQRATYRKAFVGAEVKRLIPFQISAIRKARGWSQERLALQSGLTQGVISRAEDPDNGNLTFNTVIKIASGFDVAFVGKFVPYSELARWYGSISETSVGNVATFDVENSMVSLDQNLAPTAVSAYMRGMNFTVSTEITGGMRPPISTSTPVVQQQAAPSQNANVC